jgi:hypothetical protein
MRQQGGLPASGELQKGTDSEKRCRARTRNFAMTTRTGVPLTVGLSLLLISCGHLSRPNAAAQITKKTSPNNVYPWVGTISHTCDDTLYGKLGLELGLGATPDPVQHDHIYDALSSTGYITIQPIKEHVSKVDLTALGKTVAGTPFSETHATDCDASKVHITLATLKSVDITGIVEDGINAKVNAYLWYDLTPVALAITKQYPNFYKWEFSDSYSERGVFDFVKYDDGWRIQ